MALEYMLMDDASPYLSSGVISARECVRQTLQLTGKQKVQIGRDNGVGMWVQEVGESLS
jgi:deoxyribodipyrimidine photo-lyase